VARLAVENHVDLRALAGDRPLAAITKSEVLSAIATRAAGHTVTVHPRPVPASIAPPVSAAAPPPATPRPAPAPAPAAPAAPQAGEDFIPHSRMRQLIARNTMQSAFGIPHVTTMWDVNMAAVLEHRKAHKAEFAAAGVNLTVTAYLVQAIVAALKAVPVANARWTDEGVVLKRFYHIGVAVALPPDKNGIGGLIVPVIKHASDLNLMGIARVVNDLAERARAGQLKPAELQEGTFTLTNYGTSGSRFQTPVIHDGQAGILGVGAIEKRPVVVSKGSPLEANTGDHLAFLPMTTLGFSYDHRILDGATADAFCAAVKNTLENWS
jgi:2-oxoglutarate dehydrogenase E2 component (dihydrolipoamide succinyltransferase)